jgi:hypothetical protein
MMAGATMIFKAMLIVEDLLNMGKK